EISASYRIEGLQDEERMREAASALGEIRARLAVGETAKAIVDGLGNGASEAGEGSVLQAAEKRFDAASARYYYRALPSLYELLAGAPEPGFIAPIIDDVENGRFMLPVVIESEAGGYVSFEDSKDRVRQLALESAYVEYVDKLAKDAQIV